MNISFCFPRQVSSLHLSYSCLKMCLEHQWNQWPMLEKKGQCRPVPKCQPHRTERDYVPTAGPCIYKDLEISATLSQGNTKSMKEKKKMIVKVMKGITGWILPWVHNGVVSCVLHYSGE